MIPIFSRTPQGDLIIEVDLSRFQEAFQKTPREDRIKLQDGRLGLRSYEELTDSYTIQTVHPEVWERMVFAASRQTHNMKEYLTRFEAGEAPQRSRLCRKCGAELRARLEREIWWAFYCPTCEHREVWGKQIVGGTWGAGEKEIS